MRKLKQPWKAIMSGISIAWVLFFLYTGLFGELYTMIQVPLCLMVGIFYVYVNFPLFKIKPENKDIPCGPAIYDLAIIVVGFAICLYVMINRVDFVYNPHLWQPRDFYLSVVLFLIIFEGARRSMGWVVPLIAAFMMVYAFFLGDFMPGRWWFGGVDIPSVFANRFLRSDMGYWGTLPKLACVMMPLFLVFGPILFSTGAGELFIKAASSFGNRVRGGPAHVAIIGSSLFGMISGAAVANTATVGTLTIPTMKKAGFSPSEAASVESAASAGGQIMPPIMGATAFLMADFLGVPLCADRVGRDLPCYRLLLCHLLHRLSSGRQEGVEKTGGGRYPQDERTPESASPHSGLRAYGDPDRDAGLWFHGAICLCLCPGFRCCS